MDNFRLRLVIFSASEHLQVLVKNDFFYNVQKVLISRGHVPTVPTVRSKAARGKADHGVLMCLMSEHLAPIMQDGKIALKKLRACFHFCKKSLCTLELAQSVFTGGDGATSITSNIEDVAWTDKLPQESGLPQSERLLQWISWQLAKQPTSTRCLPPSFMFMPPWRLAMSTPISSSIYPRSPWDNDSFQKCDRKALAEIEDGPVKGASGMYVPYSNHAIPWYAYALLFDTLGFLGSVASWSRCKLAADILIWRKHSNLAQNSERDLWEDHIEDTGNLSRL